MSVKQALYQYLTDPEDLPGLPAKLFARTRRIAGIDCKSRNDARRWFRDRVGRAVYSDRIPERNQNTAVELKTITTRPEYGLPGAIDGTTEYLAVTIRTRGADSSARCDTVARLISLAVAGYHGDNWGDVYIGECLIETQASTAIPPIDSSDIWTNEIRLDLTVIYVEEATPVYAADELGVEIVSTVTSDNELRLLASVRLPEGRTVEAVTWTIRETDSSGALIASITGAPYALATGTGIGGTKIEPTLDLTTLGVSGAVYLSVIVADDSGTTVNREGTIDVG